MKSSKKIIVMPIKSSQTTHFGFENVPTETKEPKVRAVFDSVANQYDLMNDLMSFGIHRLWKRFVLAKSLIKPGDVVLDVAGGSGDIASMLAKRVGEKGRVVLSDINDNMLAVGRDKLIDEGYIAQTDFVQANAEQLPFEKNTFDAVTIAFGLRNVTDKAKALASMYRVCKPGGKVMILEFSTPNSSILKSIYDAYSFHILPKLGGWVAEDEGSYQYLVESIRMHPDQNTLKSMIEAAQFEDCVYHNLSGGIVALHVAYKY